ncbi:MAG: sulfate adenylyltransferase, partial [Chloroflexota bacterium]
MSEAKTSPVLIEPHGGRLINRHIPEPENWQELGLKRLLLTPRTSADLELIANGAFSPLEGFLKQADDLGVVKEMHLANGLPWSLPVTLPVSREEAAELQLGDKLLLVSPDGNQAGFFYLEEKYEYDRAEEARLVYGTEDQAHPGVAGLYAQGEILLGGPVEVFRHPIPSSLFAPYYRGPAQTRQLFVEKGWQRVVGFQTRNPVH